jgi:hypothetical protein
MITVQQMYKYNIVHDGINGPDVVRSKSDLNPLIVALS